MPKPKLTHNPEAEFRHTEVYSIFDPLTIYTLTIPDNCNTITLVAPSTYTYLTLDNGATDPVADQSFRLSNGFMHKYTFYPGAKIKITSEGRFRYYFSATADYCCNNDAHYQLPVGTHQTYNTALTWTDVTVPDSATSMIMQAGTDGGLILYTNKANPVDNAYLGAANTNIPVFLQVYPGMLVRLYTTGGLSCVQFYRSIKV